MRRFTNRHRADMSRRDVVLGNRCLIYEEKKNQETVAEKVVTTKLAQAMLSNTRPSSEEICIYDAYCFSRKSDGNILISLARRFSTTQLSILMTLERCHRYAKQGNYAQRLDRPLPPRSVLAENIDPLFKVVPRRGKRPLPALLAHVHALACAGFKQREIATMLQLSRRTAARYVLLADKKSACRAEAISKGRELADLDAFFGVGVPKKLPIGMMQISYPEQYKRTVRSLSSIQRRTFDEYFVSEIPMREIAERADITRPAISRRIARITLAFRKAGLPNPARSSRPRCARAFSLSQTFSGTV
jgi:hypothetical protein